MKRVRLSQNKIALVSDRDFLRVNQFKWTYKNRHNGYAVSRVGIKGGRGVLMHRFILNAPKGMDVDHKDGNGLNNQRSNIRICSTQQNMRNTRKYLRKKSCSSKFKGVYKLSPRRFMWMATIGIKGKKIYLGVFEEEKSAAKAYDRAAKRYFGKFASLNFGKERG